MHVLDRVFHVQGLCWLQHDGVSLQDHLHLDSVPEGCIQPDSNANPSVNSVEDEMFHSPATEKFGCCILGAWCGTGGDS